jgi:hypothetical protein
MTIHSGVSPAGAADSTESTGAFARPVIRRAASRWQSRQRLALGLSPTPGAGVVLVLIGLALGPRGVGVISDPVLSSLDPAIAAALAAVGALAGLGMRTRRPFELRLLAGASVEGAVTLAAVAGGVLLVHALSSASQPPPVLLAVLLGICAAPSSVFAALSVQPRHAIAARLGDLDDVLPIVVGMIALAAVQAGAARPAAILFAEAAAIALAIAVAAWLLVTQTSSESEQQVFAIGALLLVGGAMAHLSLSALFGGFVAGLFWNAMPAPGRDRIAHDVRYLQHPSVVLLFVLAGARLHLSAALVGLSVAYVIFRTAGKLVGGWLARQTAAAPIPRDVGLALLSPGLVGIAFALNVLQARNASDDAIMLFTIVLLGALVSEVVALVASTRGAGA